MREFDKPIGRVWRRLRFQRFLGALVWCWGGTLLAAAVAIGVEKFADVELPGAAWWPFAIAGGVGLIVAALIALLSGPSRVDAAVAIDRVFHLNERLSTTLTLPADLRATPAGRALIADTLRHIGDLDIGSKFGVRLPRTAWVPLVPAALAVGLLFVSPDWLQSKARATSRTLDAAEQKAVSKQLKTISKSLQAQRKQLAKSEFTEAEKLLAEIEKAAEKLAKSPPAGKEKAMVELNKLTDALKERQRTLGSTDQVARQLQQLKEMASTGPADDFAKDLARGDFDKAAKELQKLKEKLASGKMSEAEKKALKDQLSEMKEQLQKLANMEQRKKQLEEALKNGTLTKEQFNKQMARLQEQTKDLQKLAQLSQKLGQAEKAMQQGDMKKAAEALGMSEKQLDQMAKNVQEMETLDQAMADIQDAKNAMSEDGTNQLGRQLEGMNGLGMNPMGNPGMGLGRGRGRGDRPEAPDNVGFHNTKTKPNYGKGKAIMIGHGPASKQTKGESVIIDQATVDAAAGGAEEALSNQKIPNNVKKQVLGYFDKIRKGD